MMKMNYLITQMQQLILNINSHLVGVSYGVSQVVQTSTYVNMLNTLVRISDTTIQITNEKYIPYCIEPSLGADRVTLAFLCDAYDEEGVEGSKDARTVLHFHPALAPYKAAILPLSKKLSGEAIKIFEQLSSKFSIDFDESQSIGKRYRRQDEIGTPYCVTFDFDSLEDNQVTVRDRDSMEQVRMPISELEAFLTEKQNSN